MSSGDAGELLERLPFVRGYGVDIGLLIDVARAVGTDAIVQVDLGTRRHRHHDLDQLGAQALSVLQTVLDRRRASGQPRHAGASRIAPAGSDVRRAPAHRHAAVRGPAPEPEVPPSLAWRT